jgi:hypothetical protein
MSPRSTTGRSRRGPLIPQSAPKGKRRDSLSLFEGRINAALSTGLVMMLTLSGCTTTADDLDAPIDWTTVDSDVSASACGLPEGDRAVPHSSPEATWTSVGDVLIPTSPLIGPGSSNGMHTCYAHSPTGALFAAVSLVADEIMFGNAALISDRAYASDQVMQAINSGTIRPESDMPKLESLALAGFRFIESTDDSVDLQLLWSGMEPGSGSPVNFALRTRLVWDENDWMFIMQSTNTAWIAVVDLADSDYTQWSSGAFAAS